MAAQETKSETRVAGLVYDYEGKINAVEQDVQMARNKYTQFLTVASNEKKAVRRAIYAGQRRTHVARRGDGEDACYSS